MLRIGKAYSEITRGFNGTFAGVTWFYGDYISDFCKAVCSGVFGLGHSVCLVFRGA